MRANVNGWELLCKISILVQPLIVAGLIFEHAPSLTQAVAGGSLAAKIVSAMIVVLSIYALIAWLVRLLMPRVKLFFRTMPAALQLLAGAMGAQAAIALNSDVYAITLIVGYLAAAAVLFAAGVLTTHEKVRGARG